MSASCLAYRKVSGDRRVEWEQEALLLSFVELGAGSQERQSLERTAQISLRKRGLSRVSIQSLGVGYSSTIDQCNDLSLTKPCFPPHLLYGALL